MKSYRKVIAILWVAIVILVTSIGIDLYKKQAKKRGILPPVVVENWYLESDQVVILPESRSLHYLVENGKKYIIIELATPNSTRKVQFKWLYKGE